MIKLVQFIPKPDMADWLRAKADQGYRSVSSVVQEILAEKMQLEASTKKDEVTLTETEATQ